MLTQAKAFSVSIPKLKGTPDDVGEKEKNIIKSFMDFFLF